MTALNFDLFTLRLYVAACETENLARAAERLHLVSSAASKRMAALEQQLGVRLFDRRRHGIAITPAGETFLEYARTLLDNAHKAEQAMAGYGAGVRGHVRLLANPSVMSGALVHDVVDFLRQPAHAAIKVDVEERYGPDVVRGVREGLATLGVTWDTVALDGLESAPYRTDHLGVAVPPGHPLARHASVPFEDTLAWEHVRMPSSSTVQALLERAAAQAGRPLVSRVMVANFDAGLPMARAGLAICTVPRELLTREHLEHGLVFVQYDNAWATRRFVVCHRGQASLGEAARHLVQHLAGCAARTTTAPG